MQCENQWHGKDWSLYQGDCVEVIHGLPDHSVGFSIFSPPFSSLFVYSDSSRDMGNCADDAEFFEHFNFLIPELHRITQDGRLCAVHCSLLPTFKHKDGFVGLRDFRGDLIRAFLDHGWIFHSEICIWKCPVLEATRTKTLGLLNKQVLKDSTMSRVGIPDHLLVFRKRGENTVPVSRVGFDEYVGMVGSYEEMPPALRTRYSAPLRTSIDVWQRYASPVWFDIRQTRVLNKDIARGDKDERHVCPLQLDVIERAAQLWTNPEEVVFTPFAGIGSEIWGAINQGRKGIGIELKPEYCNQAVKNLKELESKKRQPTLFDMRNRVGKAS